QGNALVCRTEQIVESVPELPDDRSRIKFAQLRQLFARAVRAGVDEIRRLPPALRREITKAQCAGGQHETDEGGLVVEHGEGMFDRWWLVVDGRRVLRSRFAGSNSKTVLQYNSKD